ncbi:hypothetical protein ASD21_22645 [Caulobacter sp. Root1455]|uniref:outer membrane lipoprotein-sorting protein n=1 Tax=Caulobacter sp. Root1455 TaxID=1736465 RepID=UPI0006FF6BFC|nr:outer membrane lipoprotein-sorting protein [Caulobacter sp. Root1455]KQY98679.1 hypothetical protein ASD21_22645 [Caulobacter sp. Root1455]
MPCGTSETPAWRRREVLLALASPALLAQAAPSAQQILVTADRVRNGGRPFSTLNTLTEYRNGAVASTLALRIYSKLDAGTQQYRNLVRYVAPAADAGKIMLMDGRLMWFYDPSSSATVRVSPQQRLTGQASNGDVLTVNLAKDYAAKTAKREQVVDADRADRACWRLDMTAANDRAVYARLEHWIDAASSLPVKTKYYADSGRLLKIVYYRAYQTVLGGTRPLEAIILDQIDNRLTTKMRFSDFQAADIPDAWFQRDYLPHLGSR